MLLPTVDMLTLPTRLHDLSTSLSELSQDVGSRPQGQPNHISNECPTFGDRARPTFGSVCFDLLVRTKTFCRGWTGS